MLVLGWLVLSMCKQWMFSKTLQYQALKHPVHPVLSELYMVPDSDNMTAQALQCASIPRINPYICGRHAHIKTEVQVKPR